MVKNDMVSIRLGADVKEMIRLVAEADRKPGRSVSVSDWCMKAIMAKLILHPRYREFAERVQNEQEATNAQTQ